MLHRLKIASPSRYDRLAVLTPLLAIAFLVILPFAGLLREALRGSPGLWQHLAATVLPIAMIDTVLLLAGVGLIAAVLGTSTAWIVSAYQFPGRWVLQWALLLPLAVPTYIIAYAYLDILHPIGPVQEAIRWMLGYDSPRQFRLPDIRSMAGCILLLGFVLYPYVYIPTRAMFLTQSGSLVDAARTLGVSQGSIFWRVALPLARPAMAVGVCLALMETLNDVGAAEFLGVRTLTVTIYTTWITRTDLPGAAQIALALLAIVILLVMLERWARQKQSFVTDARRNRPLSLQKTSTAQGLALLVAGTIPIVVGFGAPVLYLMLAAWERYRFAGVSERLFNEAIATMGFATAATLVTISLGLATGYSIRFSKSRSASGLFRILMLGYAAPGTVVAIAVLVVLARADQFVDAALRQWLGVSVGLVFLGSGAAVIYALTVRFIAISAGSIEAGFARIPASFDEAARTLGQTSSQTFRKVHLPLSKTMISAAAILVFVDCVKELPATLLLRPLNVETFATHLYGEAARGTYEEAAIVALAIVAVGLLPVILLSRIGARS